MFLSSKEMKEARKNGFLIIGQIGAGKSTLLNVIIGKDVAETGRSISLITKNTEVYYLKLKNGKYITLVDTPGLSDPQMIGNEEANKFNINLKGIIKDKILKKKIHIKGILYLVNFQMERFDYQDQEALLNYNTFFPFKRFWKHLIIAFTHSYEDPNEDISLEEIRNSRDQANEIIFSKLMEKVKEVSDPISYKEIKVKYYNSHSPGKNDKQRLLNEKNKEDIEKLFDDFIPKEPLF
jgi:GTP-binding protein EngB required for normal cell division